MSCAKHIFVFSAVLMASVTLSSCSKDDKDDVQNVPEQSAVIDGKVYNLTTPKYSAIAERDQSYILYLYLGDKGCWIRIEGDAEKYNGKIIDLTKTEEKFEDDASNWDITCCNPDGEGWLFEGKALEEDEDEVGIHKYVRFSSGTMKIDFNSKKQEFNVEIRNAQIKDPHHGDKQTHTLELRWKGKASQIKS
jgi:lipoprotein